MIVLWRGYGFLLYILLAVSVFATFFFSTEQKDFVLAIGLAASAFLLIAVGAPLNRGRQRANSTEDVRLAPASGNKAGRRLVEKCFEPGFVQDLFALDFKNLWAPKACHSAFFILPQYWSVPVILLAFLVWWLKPLAFFGANQVF